MELLEKMELSFLAMIHVNKKMNNSYSQTEDERRENFKFLIKLKIQFLNLSQELQRRLIKQYRITDLAIDFAEDVPKLPQE